MTQDIYIHTYIEPFYLIIVLPFNTYEQIYPTHYINTNIWRSINTSTSTYINQYVIIQVM